MVRRFVIRLCPQLLVVVILGCIVGCQPIAIRSVTNDACPVVETPKAQGCPKAIETYDAADWLIQQQNYCRSEVGASAGTVPKKMLIKGVSDERRQQLQQLAELLCSEIAVNAGKGEFADTTEVFPESDLVILLDKLKNGTGWGRDFQALFSILGKLAKENQQLRSESQQTHLEMQQKIDALMQIEKDISRREAK